MTRSAHPHHQAPVPDAAPPAHAHTANANTVSAMEARKRFGQLLEETFYRGDSFIIERSGRAMAVLVPVETFARLQDDHERRAETSP